MKLKSLLLISVCALSGFVLTACKSNGDTGEQRYLEAKTVPALTLPEAETADQSDYQETYPVPEGSLRTLEEGPVDQFPPAMTMPQEKIKE